MNISVTVAFLSTVLLVALRLAGVFLFTPLFLAVNVPVQVRVLFLIALSTFLVIDLPRYTDIQTIQGLLLAGAGELLLGAVLSFGISAIFALFSFGGRLLDFQMGFSVANVVDPSTNTQAPLMGTFLQLTAISAFFLANGHHMLIRGLAYSFEAVPVGEMLAGIPLPAILTQFGLMFSYGLMLVAPAVVTLLLIDIGFAVAARTMPQVNMFIVAMPLKVFVGLFILATSLSYLGPFLTKTYAAIFEFWNAVLREASHG